MRGDGRGQTARIVLAGIGWLADVYGVLGLPGRVGNYRLTGDRAECYLHSADTSSSSSFNGAN